MVQQQTDTRRVSLRQPNAYTVQHTDSNNGTIEQVLRFKSITVKQHTLGSEPIIDNISVLIVSVTQFTKYRYFCDAVRQLWTRQDYRETTRQHVRWRSVTNFSQAWIWRMFVVCDITLSKKLAVSSQHEIRWKRIICICINMRIQLNLNENRR